MKTIKHVFAATDLSPPSLHAVDRAFDIARAAQAECTVMTALGVDVLGILKGLLGEEADSVATRLAAEQRRMLSDIVADPERNQGVQAQVLVAEGLPGRAVADSADERAADLVVLGARGASSLRRLVFGSTAAHVVRKSRCPVLVVKNPALGPYRRVLLPVDFSPAAVDAIALAQRLAPDAELVLLNVFEVPFAGMLRQAGVAEDVIDHYRTESSRSAFLELRALAARAGLDQGRYTAFVKRGDITECILDTARTQHCDLLVMVKHGVHVSEELLLGSVTSRVMAEAGGDLLVLVDKRTASTARRRRVAEVDEASEPTATATPVPQRSGTPARLLLATDLGPRCDRALDRALELADAWQARLTAVNVITAPNGPEEIIAWISDDPSFTPQADARRQLRHDLAALGSRADVRFVRETDPVAALLRIAAETHSDLVVTGVARDEPLSRFLLGSTVARLARRLEYALLIVRNRVRHPYRRIVVASDLSPAAGAALRCVRGWFPRASLTVFHAEHAPAPTVATPLDAPPRPAGAAVRADCERFVVDAGLAREDVDAVVAVRGALEVELTRHVRMHDCDLVVLGAHESRTLLDTLRGATLDEVLQWLPSDVLVVPADDGRDSCRAEPARDSS